MAFLLDCFNLSSKILGLSEKKRLRKFTCQLVINYKDKLSLYCFIATFITKNYTYRYFKLIFVLKTSDCNSFNGLPDK